MWGIEALHDTRKVSAFRGLRSADADAVDREKKQFLREKVLCSERVCNAWLDVELSRSSRRVRAGNERSEGLEVQLLKHILTKQQEKPLTMRFVPPPSSEPATTASTTTTAPLTIEAGERRIVRWAPLLDALSLFQYTSDLYDHLNSSECFIQGRWLVPLQYHTGGFDAVRVKLRDNYLGESDDDDDDDNNNGDNNNNNRNNEEGVEANGEEQEERKEYDLQQKMINVTYFQVVRSMDRLHFEPHHMSEVKQIIVDQLAKMFPGEFCDISEQFYFVLPDNMHQLPPLLSPSDGRTTSTSCIWAKNETASTSYTP